MSTNRELFLNHLEQVHNKISDQNLIWFPFNFLKPEPTQPIFLGRHLLMTLCFSLFFSAAYGLKQLLWSQPTDFHSMLRVQLWAQLGFFMWFKLVTIYFWNKRAFRLLRESEKPNALTSSL